MTVGQDVKIEVDLINEQVILGATIAGWGTDVADKMFRTFGPDHFLGTEHSTAWGPMRELHKRKLDWDIATLKQLGGGVVGDETCDYLASLSDRRQEVPANLDHHVKVMLQDRAKRTTMDGPVTALIEAMKDPLADPDHLHAIARQIPASLKSGDRKSILDGKALVRSQIEQIKARKDAPSFPYGLDGLDYYESQDAAKRAGILKPENIADADGRVRRMSPGAEPGYITLISAQTGGGKTTLASALALTLAQQDRKVLYCAWEPKAGLTLESIACQWLKLSRSRVLQGQASAAEIKDLKRVMNRLVDGITFMDKSLFFDFGGGKKKRSNEANLDVFASHVAESGCDVVIADLWKYMLVSQKPEEEEEALKLQQAMCEDLKFHLFLLQQQAHKRDGQRSDKRPSRDGVKGSGAYLEIVDTFLAPHIPSLWKPGIPPDRFELFVLKQRYGRWPLGIQFDWDPDSGALSGGTTIPYDNLVEERGGAKGEPYKGRKSLASLSDDGSIGEDVVFARPEEPDREA